MNGAEYATCRGTRSSAHHQPALDADRQPGTPGAYRNQEEAHNSPPPPFDLVGVRLAGPAAHWRVLAPQMAVRPAATQPGSPADWGVSNCRGPRPLPCNPRQRAGATSKRSQLHMRSVHSPVRLITRLQARPAATEGCGSGIGVRCAGGGDVGGPRTGPSGWRGACGGGRAAWRRRRGGAQVGIGRRALPPRPGRPVPTAPRVCSQHWACSPPLPCVFLHRLQQFAWS